MCKLYFLLWYGTGWIDLKMWDGSASEGTVLTIKCSIVLGEVYVGASIAVNGTCLTVTSFVMQNGAKASDSSGGGTFTG